MAADIIFNVANGTLTGRVGSLRVNAQAVSGGRGGSTTPGAVNPLMVNNYFSTRVKLDSKDPASIGGTVPLGHYRLSLYPPDRRKTDRKNWIMLKPTADTHIGTRNGLAIHGMARAPGSRGSDGCIVPTDFNVVLSMVNELDMLEKKGMPEPLLAVICVGQHLDAKAKMAGRLA